MKQAHFNVCVVGGGPAGSVAALRLAQLGYRVGIVERDSFPRFHVGESLSKGIWPILDILGLRGAILREDFLYADEILVRWEHPETERLVGQNSAGLLVNRGTFDAFLLKAAGTAGVRIMQPATACVANNDFGWRVQISSRGHTSWISADFLVDATGRRQFLPGPRNATSPPTLAICGHLESRGRTHPTLIEALSDGWCWGASIPGNQFSAMIFVDPITLRQQRPVALEEFWRSRLAKADLFAGVLGYPLLRPIVAHNATTGFAIEPIGINFVRVGEANFSLDPLSSTGVEKAMQTGFFAAIALHTIIHKPERRDLCMRFYRARQHETISVHAAWSSDFYRRVRHYEGLPFWQARSGPSGGGSLTPVWSNSSPRNGSFGLATRVRLSDKSRLVEEPCIVGNEMCAKVALLHPSLRRPVAFLEGIELERLLAMVPAAIELGRLLTLWSSRVSPKQASHVAEWLINNQILESVS